MSPPTERDWYPTRNSPGDDPRRKIEERREPRGLDEFRS
jgi:hypothetical protein